MVLMALCSVDSKTAGDFEFSKNGALQILPYHWHFSEDDEEKMEDMLANARQKKGKRAMKKEPKPKKEKKPPKPKPVKKGGIEIADYLKI